jgi:hypothetical protein
MNEENLAQMVRVGSLSDEEKSEFRSGNVESIVATIAV